MGREAADIIPKDRLCLAIRRLFARANKLALKCAAKQQKIAARRAGLFKEPTPGGVTKT